MNTEVVVQSVLVHAGGAPEQFGTAWTAHTRTMDEAAAQISAAVTRACPEARRLESYEAPSGRYLRFAVNGKLGVDNVEFLVKNEGVGDRGWEGDEKIANDWLVRVVFTHAHEPCASD